MSGAFLLPILKAVNLIWKKRKNDGICNCQVWNAVIK